MIEIEKDLDGYKKILEVKFRKYYKENSQNTALLEDFYNKEINELNRMFNLPENENKTFLSVEGYGKRCAILGAFIESIRVKFDELELAKRRKKEAKEKEEKKYWQETEMPIDIIFRIRDEKRKERGRKRI